MQRKKKRPKTNWKILAATMNCFTPTHQVHSLWFSWNWCGIVKFVKMKWKCTCACGCATIIFILRLQFFRICDQSEKKQWIEMGPNWQSIKNHRKKEEKIMYWCVCLLTTEHRPLSMSMAYVYHTFHSTEIRLLLFFFWTLFHWICSENISRTEKKHDHCFR